MKVEEVSVGEAIMQLAPLVEAQASKKGIELSLVQPDAVARRRAPTVTACSRSS